MNVIRHQTVAQQRQPPALRPAAEGLQVEATVVVEQENVLAVVAPLSGVVWNALRDHARDARQSARYRRTRTASTSILIIEAVPVSPSGPGSFKSL